MSKRKLPPLPKVWARIVNGREWEVILANGQVLRHSEDIDIASVRTMSASIPVFLIGYGLPVEDLSNDADGLRAAISEINAEGFEYNTAHVFSSREGTRAVILDHHH